MCSSLVNNTQDDLYCFNKINIWLWKKKKLFKYFSFCACSLCINSLTYNVMCLLRCNLSQAHFKQFARCVVSLPADRQMLMIPIQCLQPSHVLIVTASPVSLHIHEDGPKMPLIFSAVAFQLRKYSTKKFWGPKYHPLFNPLHFLRKTVFCVIPVCAMPVRTHILHKMRNTCTPFGPSPTLKMHQSGSHPVDSMSSTLM